MRIAIIAVNHGNLPALEVVLADIQRRDIDRTINLGIVSLAPFGLVRSVICL